MDDPNSHNQPDLVEDLTEREMDVLRLKALKRSNQEIADELVLALSTVKWYVRQLYGKLGVENQRQATARAQALGLIEGPSTPGIRPRHNLPTQTTRFIGREQELDDLEALLADPEVRLITILGPGGMGKTRLGLAVADAHLDRFADGVYMVPLAPLQSPEQIVITLAEAIHCPFVPDERTPAQQVLDFLYSKHMLLMLDNFEHVLDGAELVQAILQTVPTVQMIVTSRERLALSGEVVYTLSGMSFPDWETPEDAAALHADTYDAVRLFLQRAESISPGFDIHRDDLRSLARICRLVEGLPLGIVLAAAWAQLLSLKEIADEIQNSFDFLATEMRDMPHRQRSIRAVFDPTWNRLADHERDIFKRFSVFQGGCTRAAAQAVTGADLRMLQTLVNKALLERDMAGRFDMHELWQRYAAEKLTDSPREQSLAQHQHAQYYAAFVHEQASLIRTGQTGEALTEIENIRAAWQNSVERQSALHIRQLMDGVSWLYELRGWYREASQLFEAAVHALRSEVPTGEAGIVLGRLLGLLGWFKGRCGAHETGYALIKQGIAILHQLEARDEIALTQVLLGRLANTQDEAADAYRLCEESLQHLDGGSLSMVASAQIALADLANLMGDHDAARFHAQVGEDINREIDSPRGYAGAMRAQGDAAAATGDHDTAEQRYLDSLETYQNLGYRQGMIWSLRGLGRLELDRGKDGAAWGYFREAVEIAMDLDLVPQALDALVSMAELLVRREDWPHAAEALTLVRQHPAANAETQAAAGRMLADHEADLAPHLLERPARQSEQQRAMQLKALVTELLDL